MYQWAIEHFHHESTATDCQYSLHMLRPVVCHADEMLMVTAGSDRVNRLQRFPLHILRNEYAIDSIAPGYLAELSNRTGRL